MRLYIIIGVPEFIFKKLKFVPIIGDLDVPEGLKCLDFVQILNLMDDLDFPGLIFQNIVSLPVVVDAQDALGFRCHDFL